MFLEKHHKIQAEATQHEIRLHPSGTHGRYSSCFLRDQSASEKLCRNIKPTVWKVTWLQDIGQKINSH